MKLEIDQLFSQAYLWASCLYDCAEIQKKLDKGPNHHHLSLFFLYKANDGQLFLKTIITSPLCALTET